MKKLPLYLAFVALASIATACDFPTAPDPASDLTDSPPVFIETDCRTTCVQEADGSPLPNSGYE